MADSQPHEMILQSALEFYIGSRDFNGIPAGKLLDLLEISESQFREVLLDLLRAGSITLAFARVQDNPHILRMVPLPISELEELLEDEPLSTFCIYPTVEILNARPDLMDYEDLPFSRRLALGEAQLTPVYFELSVLETYYRDPRYHFNYFDLGGQISVRDEAYFSKDMPERDKVVLETFGIAYDKEGNRVIVVFLRYLSNLSPEHQRIWHSQIISRECVMNNDYARSSLYGQWPQHYSVYQALLAEILEINKLANLVGRSTLFRRDCAEERPVELHPLLRPTRRNLHEFVQFFDKLLSDNIDRDFFGQDIPLEEEIERDDGRIEVVQKGTLRILEEWLHRYYRTQDGEDVSKEVIAPFKTVRKLRQEPAHKITEDVYDVALAREQDQIVSDVVIGLRNIRYILMSHPMIHEEYEPPDWLDGDDIVIY